MSCFKIHGVVATETFRGEFLALNNDDDDGSTGNHKQPITCVKGWTSSILIHPHKVPWGGYYNRLHFTNNETESRKGQADVQGQTLSK